MDEYDRLEFSQRVILDGKIERALRKIEDDYVAWARFSEGRINTCDSTADGAFCVYRRRSIERALRVLLEDL